MARKWTDEENDKLTKFLNESKSHDDIAKELGRPKSTIKTKAIIYAKSLLESGESESDVCSKCGVDPKDLADKPKRKRKEETSPTKKESSNTKKKDDLSEIHEKLDKIIELLSKQ